MTLTLEQQKAVAIATAKLKLMQQQSVASDRPAPGQDPAEWKRLKAEAAKSGNLQVSPDQAAGQAAIDTPVEQQLRDPGAMSALVSGFTQGATFGFGDEIQGAAGAAISAGKDVVSGNFSGIGSRAADSYAATRDLMRANNNNAQFARPKTVLAGEVVGALATPIPGPKGVHTLGEAVKVGAKTGAVIGGLTGVGRSDGGALESIKSGLEGAVAGAIFGAAVPVAIKGASKLYNRLATKAVEKPSIENLRAAKTIAYDAVDKAGEVFTPSDLSQIVTKARQGLDDVNYLPESDLVTTGIIKKLESVASKDTTLGQLDKFRQSVWQRYNTSKEPGLLEVIDAIDETVSSRASTSAILDAARSANAKFKKAELLDLAFTKATDQTSSTGSGGNIVNKMRQAVTSIINNPKQAKWFNADEISVMREFIRGTKTQNALRLVGKLSPSGNGLMTALNLGAAGAFGGPALAVSAGATAAKALNEAAAGRVGANIIAKVAGTAAKAPEKAITYPMLQNRLAGIGSNAVLNAINGGK